METKHFGADASKTCKRSVKRRIQTFDDDYRELGKDNQLVEEYDFLCAGDFFSPDIIAYSKLRIIRAALNEGWELLYARNKWGYCPIFNLCHADEEENMGKRRRNTRGLIGIDCYRTEFAGLELGTVRTVGPEGFISTYSSLCLKSEELAIYCGRQFIDIWADFLLIRK